MLGSGVPVCAAEFATIKELIRHGKNGLVFNSYEELKTYLIELLFEHDCNGYTLMSLRESCRKISFWDENWDEVAPNFLIRILDLKVS